MSVHTIWIKDARFRQAPDVKPTDSNGGETTAPFNGKENKTESSAGATTAAVGGMYLAGKVVQTATAIAMFEIDKVGSRNGQLYKQVQIQNTLNKFALGKKGLAYGSSAAAGAIAGAAVGSVVPGLGTAAGFLIGGAIGLVQAGVNDYNNYDNARYERLRNNFEIRENYKEMVWSNNNNRFAGGV